MRRLFITGGTGFIGQRLTHRLNATGYEYLSSTVRATATHADCIDELHGFDVVIHLAGRAHSVTSEDDRAEYHLVNTEFPLRLATAAIESSVQKFIFVSSVQAAQYQDDVGPNSELHSNWPTDIYGASKREAEQALQALDWKDTQLLILRPCLLFGAGAKANIRSLLKHGGSRFIPIVRGAGRRSMLHVDDFCALLMAAVEAGPLAVGPYIVAGECAPDINELRRAVVRAQGGKAPFWSVSADTLKGLAAFVKLLTANKLDLGNALSKVVEDRVYDSTLLASRLPWRPELSFEGSVAEMLSALGLSKTSQLRNGSVR